MDKKLLLEYEEFENADTQPEEIKNLLKKAVAALSKSYAPYSNFNVGAAALLDDGSIIIGANLENAAYPVGICAERVLLSNLLCLDNPPKIIAIAITYKNKNGSSDVPIFPCGMCRQALLEQENNQNKVFKIYCFSETGKMIKLQSTTDLLPLSFSFKDLK